MNSSFSKSAAHKSHPWCTCSWPPHVTGSEHLTNRGQPLGRQLLGTYECCTQSVQGPGPTSTWQEGCVTTSNARDRITRPILAVMVTIDVEMPVLCLRSHIHGKGSRHHWLPLPPLQKKDPQFCSDMQLTPPGPTRKCVTPPQPQGDPVTGHPRPLH